MSSSPDIGGSSTSGVYRSSLADNGGSSTSGVCGSSSPDFLAVHHLTERVRLLIQMIQWFMFKGAFHVMMLVMQLCAIDPQPQCEDMVKLSRYYADSALTRNYKRGITTLLTGNKRQEKALIEYLSCQM